MEGAHVLAGTPVACNGTLVGTVVVDGHVGVLAAHVGDLEVKSGGVAQDVGRGEVGCLCGEGRSNRKYLDCQDLWIAETEEVTCLNGYIVITHGCGGACYLTCAVVQQQSGGQARGREAIRILRCLYREYVVWRHGAVAVPIVVYGSDLGSVERFGIDAEVVQHTVHSAALVVPCGPAAKL